MKLHVIPKLYRFILTFLFLALSNLLPAQTFVDASASGNNDGSSWTDAYTDLNVALANTTNGEIWVAADTYKPTTCNPCEMADRDIAFDIPPAVQLYGGFAGNEALLSQRDWTINLTVLSGDIGVPADSTDNSFRVLTARNSLSSTVLDGFIIEEGNADGSFGFSAGGGLLIDANDNGTGDLQVRHCTFRNNYAGGGGGIAIDCVLGGVCRALIRDCLFEGNTASLQVVSTGAAIFMQGNSGAQVEPRIINCTFRENFSGNDGGAISMTPTGEGSLLATLVDSCQFLNNRAVDRGAAIWYRMSSSGTSAVMIRNSQFIENSSGGQGAAIFARSSFDNVSNDTIMNCLFSRNITDGSSAQNDGEGGAIFLRGSQNGTRNHQIINCAFDRNRAEHRGGAIATTSFVSDAGTCNANIVNCTFSGNTTPGNGGAIHTEGTDGVNTMTIANSIFWQDTALVDGQEIFNNGASVSMAYSDIAGGVPATVNDDGNNLDVDPQFGDAANGDLRLTGCSPLLNIGDNTVLPSIASLDLDGFPRIHEEIVDLGAYEIGIIYVDHTATAGTNNGRSWANAFIDLQDALSVAASGRQIWVAQGTYFPTSCSPCTEMDRRTPFNLVSNTEVYGGFNGTETQLAQRDWIANPTIMSGDIGIPIDSTDNSIRVLVAKNTSDKTILDGFIIEEGNADGSFGFSSGGGLLIDANNNGLGNIQVRHCTFRNNYAGGGGGIAIDCVLGGVCRAVIRDCIFEGNTASLQVVSTGAGIFMQGNSGAQIEPQIINCTFRENFSGNDGGAISMTPTGEGSVLATLIDSCLFLDNRAVDRGAAIWYRMSSFGESRVVIRNSQFIGNTGGGQGAAIFARSSFDNIANDTILNCLFSLNSTDGSSLQNDGEGGAIFLRGSQNGVRNHQIINCVFYRNSAAQRGGAIGTTSIVSAAGTCNADIINCTFYGNSTQGDGGVIHAEGTEGTNTMNLTNNILWNNTADGAGKELFNNAGTITLAHNDIEGGLPENVIDGGENIALDPQFLDAENGDLHLSACSPALNAGLNMAIPPDQSDLDNDGDTAEPIPFDLDDEPRIFEETVDMGAYEWNGEPPALNISFDTTHVSCAGICDGTATVQTTGGVPGYNFLWSTGQSTETIGDLCPGIYQVTIFDSFSCEIVDSVEIFDNDEPTLMPMISGVQSLCTDSMAILEAGTFANYNWSTGDTTQQIIITAEGAYSVTVSDENGCTGSDTLVVTEVANPQVQISIAPTFCPGTPSILNAGIGFESYLWSDGSTGQTLTVTEAGDYSVTVTNADGCSGTAQVTLVENEPLEPDFSGDLSFCEGDSTLIDAGDFTTYLWTTGDSTQQITITESGEYGVTITDGNGCVGSGAVTVEAQPNPEAQILGAATFCPGSSTVLDGGDDFASYLWSDGTTTQTLSVMTAGIYSLTITDTNGCIDSTEITVTEDEELAPMIAGDLSFCADSSTVLDAGVFDSYEWSTGDTTQQLMVAESGTFEVTVSDNNGCTGSTAAIVEELEPFDVTITGSTTFCLGSSTILEGSEGFDEYLWSDGSNEQTLVVSTEGQYGLTVTDANGCTASTEVMVTEEAELEPIINGTLSFCPDSMTVLDAGTFDSYEWTTGDTTQQIMVNEIGTYGVTVSDNAGCTGMTEVLVEQLPMPEVAIAGSTTFCPGSSTTLDASAGFMEYLWSNGSTEQSLTVMTEGLYALTVTDSNGCVGTTEIMVTESAELQPMISGNLSFCQDSMTMLDAGTFDSYEWTTGDTTQQIAVSESGSYGVTVSDNAGCMGMAEVLVEQLPTPEVAITGSSTFCPGSSTTLEATAGFMEYLWSNGATEQSLTVMNEGLYELTVTDANGCVATTEIMVSENAELQPMINGNLSFCPDSMTVLDAGAFDSYEWTTGDTTQQITVNQTGSYGVTVNDDAGCTGMTEVLVEQFPAPEVEITGSTTFCPGSATTLEATAGFMEYLWSNGSMEQSLTVMNEGFYQLTVTDTNGCMGTTEIMVTENAELQPTISGNLSLCTDSTTILDAGTFAIYEWTTGDTTQSISVSEAGQYGVSVNDGMGCSGTDQVTVAASPIPTANDDSFAILDGEDRSATFDLIQNDDLSGLSNWTINILAPPTFGLVDDLQDGLLSYTAPDEGTGVAILTYELCNPDCPGSCSEATVTIRVTAEEVTIANGITPNGDGLNDTFVFDQLDLNTPDQHPDNELVVYNRWGDIVYRKKPYDNSWDGTNQNGQELPEATYYYILYLDIGEGVILRGDVTVIRGR